ncbi:MAG: hypothetical protein K2Y31_06385 [Burkholderiales bacterium]|jgi:hypothetical protein|nr:hypothetical protein [Burkholderiales bacterium]
MKSLTARINKLEQKCGETSSPVIVISFSYEKHLPLLGYQRHGDSMDPKDVIIIKRRSRESDGDLLSRAIAAVPVGLGEAKILRELRNPDLIRKK